MRKLRVLLVVVVCVFSFVPTLFAAGDVVDSVRVAQVFAGMKIDSYVGQFNFQRRQNGDISKSEWVSADFKMSSDGKITWLVINDSVIVGDGDQPLNGLPVNAIGETRDFYLYLATPDGKASGSFQKSLLLPGEPIEVSLKPGWVPQIIPFAGKGATLAENSALKTDSGGTFSYDPNVSGFWVWVDPLKASIAYTIVDTVTGLVVSSGSINPKKDGSTDNNSVVNVKWIGGVMTVPNGDYAYLDNQKLDGQLADSTPAKVYIWSLNGQSGNIGAWSNEGKEMGGGMHISVLRWLSSGEMPEIVSGDGNVSIGDGYDKVIVIITGMEKFNVNFSTSSNRVPSVGGGGKG